MSLVLVQHWSLPRATPSTHSSANVTTTRRRMVASLGANATAKHRRQGQDRSATWIETSVYAQD